MGIKLEGFKEWENKLKAAEKSLGYVPANTLSEVMQIGAKIALQECPEVSGFLRSTINYQIFRDSSGKEVGELNVDASYADYVNSGVSGHKRTPFFSNAVIAMNIAVFRIMERNTKLALEGKLQASSDEGMGKRGGNQQLKPHKYLFKTRSQTGRTRYIFPKGNRPGTVKFRGKIYRGRNYSARFESA